MLCIDVRENISIYVLLYRTIKNIASIEVHVSLRTKVNNTLSFNWIPEQNS